MPCSDVRQDGPLGIGCLAAHLAVITAAVDSACLDLRESVHFLHGVSPPWFVRIMIVLNHVLIVTWAFCRFVYPALVVCFMYRFRFFCLSVMQHSSNK